MAVVGVSTFAGVWSRTMLFEPAGATTACDTSTLVLWIQSSAGMFIDLRIPAGDRPPERCKSFAGTSATSVNASGRLLLTWTRELDYRLPGTPDVGAISFVSPDEIEEDGVLPGDDYKEVWHRMQAAGAHDAAVRLRCRSDPSRHGIWIRVGDTAAVALARPSSSTAIPAEWFDGRTLSDSQRSVLTSFVTCVGSIRDNADGVPTLHVQHSTVVAFQDAIVPLCAVSVSGGFVNDCILALHEFVVDRIEQGDAPAIFL